MTAWRGRLMEDKPEAGPDEGLAAFLLDLMQGRVGEDPEKPEEDPEDSHGETTEEGSP